MKRIHDSLIPLEFWDEFNSRKRVYFQEKAGLSRQGWHHWEGKLRKGEAIEIERFLMIAELLGFELKRKN